MINFLRKLRRENMNGKYIKYAFGEIFLVVIGILIALGINNWNENRKAANFEQEILEEVLASLSRDATELYQLQISFEEADASIHKTLLFAEGSRDKSQRDSIPYWLGKFMSFDRFNPSSSVYEVLKSQGLQNITNKGLRLLIAEYYDEAIPAIVEALRDVEDEFESSMINHIKAEFRDFRFQEMALPNDIDAYLNDHRNIVYFKIFRDNRNGSLDDLAYGIGLNKEIRVRIQQEIN